MWICIHDTDMQTYVYTHVWYTCVYVILVYMCRLMIVTHWDSFKGASYDSKNVLMNILHSKNII